jgi:FkbM family methyltransferase
MRLSVRGTKEGRRSSSAHFREQQKLETLRHNALRRLNYGNDDKNTNGEIWFIRHLAGTLPTQPVVFDIGANIGTYTQALIDELDAPIVHSFEPSQSAFTLLEQNLSDSPDVHVHNLGLGAEEGMATLYADEPGSAMGSLYPRKLDHFRINMRPLEQVRIVRLDKFCAEEGIERIDFLKIDAEGHDLSVLQSAGEMLDPERIGAIQFEFGGTAIDSHIYLRDFFYLLTPRYTIHRLLPDAVWPLRLYREEDEVLVYANYICLPSAQGAGLAL